MFKSLLIGYNTNSILEGDGCVFSACDGRNQHLDGLAKVALQRA